MRKHKLKSAFTLVELIISIAVLSIILVAFLSLFGFSMTNLFRAGDKSEAFNISLSKIESQIAAGEGFYADNMTLSFDGKSIEIPGGYFDTVSSLGLSESRLKGFIPFIPTIEISPSTLVEGTNTPVTINVTGHNTNFKNTTKVEVWDIENSVKLYDIAFVNASDDLSTTTIDESKTKGSFQIDNDLVNAFGDHVIKVITTGLDNGRTEITKAKLTLLMPLLVTIDNNSIFVSEDGEKWVERSNDIDFPGATGLYDLSFIKNGFHVIGLNNLLHVDDFEDWERDTLTGITGGTAFSNILNNYYASSSNGTIYNSVNGINWSSHYVENSNPLYDIVSIPDGKVIAVGNEIIVFRDSVGTFSKITTDLNGVNLYGVDYFSSYDSVNDLWSHTFAAVGYNGTQGVIMSSSDGLSWTKTLIGSSKLNDIYYAGNNVQYVGPKWLVVGDNGTLFTSNDLITWNNNSLAISNDFSDAIVSNKRIFIIGTNGVVVRSGENDLNFTSKTISSDDLNAITGR